MIEFASEFHFLLNLELIELKDTRLLTTAVLEPRDSYMSYLHEESKFSFATFWLLFFPEMMKALQRNKIAMQLFVLSLQWKLTICSFFFFFNYQQC